MALLSRPAAAHAITLGQGRTRPQGRRVELDATDPISALARVLAQHTGEDAWWSASTFDGDRRHGDRWTAACALALDLDYHDEAGEHATCPRDVSQAAAEALGDLPSLVHNTPRGARVIVVLAEPVTNRELFSRCARGLVTEAAKRLGALLRAAPPRKPGAAGLVLDPTVTGDCARFLWTPGATVDGVQRAAVLVDTRTEPMAAVDLAELAPAPPPAPAAADLAAPAWPTTPGPDAWAAVRVELLRRLSVRAVLSANGVTVGDNGAKISCPIHQPDAAPSAWIHPGDDGLERLYCGHGRRGGGLGVETAGGKLQLDAIDLVAHFRGLTVGKATAALARELGISTPRPAKAQAAAPTAAGDADAWAAELVAGGDYRATMSDASIARLAALPDAERRRVLEVFKATWPKAGVWRGLASSARAKRRELAAADPEDTRPPVNVTDPRGDLATDAIVAALAETDAPLFVRGGGLGLSRIVAADAADRGPLKREDGAPIMACAPLPWLRDLVERAARCYGVRRTKDGDMEEYPARCPAELIDRLAARGRWKGLRYLAGIASGPVLRPDGTLATRPGWDESTGLLLDFDPTAWPAIPERPTLDDARRAYTELVAPFLDFPFVAPCDAAAFVALVLSVLARDAYDGPAPGFAISAPTAGTGKSLLATAAGIVATGRAPAIRTWPDKAEEVRKTLLALALAGDSLVVLDNLAGPLDSGELAATLTARTVAGRVLGESREVTAAWRAVVAVTGNNLAIRGDLARRMLPIKLDSHLETPEDRADFHVPDLLGHIRERRPHLAAAALTLLRAHVVAGRPRPTGMSAYGSFDGWNDVIRAAVLWATTADPRERAGELRADDPERQAYGALLAAWHGALGDKPHTAADLLAAANTLKMAGDDTLSLALAELSLRELTTAGLGYVLRRMAGRPIDGLRLERTSKGKLGVRWFAVKG